MHFFFKKILLNLLYISLILLLAGFQPLICQFTESFDSDLSSWSGNVEDYIVNDENQLQLNAAEEGESLIWRAVEFPEEFDFEMFFKLDFSPSANNLTRIYYYLDNVDLTLASGYYMEIGENGSTDAIAFYKLENGTPELLARATMGAVASDPAQAAIRLTKISGGIWSFNTDYEGGSLLVPDAEFFSDEIEVKGSGFFAIYAKYTSSRTSLFFYDDIELSIYEEDVLPPQVIDVIITDAMSVQVTFDELLDEITAEEPANYVIQENGNLPADVDVDNNVVTLHFSEAFLSGPTYSISISDVEDTNGNVSENIIVTGLFLSVPPNEREIIINEILFDPYSGEEDFVEIYNRSEKIIGLKDVEIVNAQKQEIKIISENHILLPGEYIAFSPDPGGLINTYIPLGIARIESQSLPAFNNDEGNVGLRYEGISIDSFDYREDMHSLILKDVEGVSLERISPESESNEETNWTSGVQTTLFSTPGYQNAAYIQNQSTEELISLRHSSFSPNGDGERDQLIIDYNLPKSGYIANIDIYNDLGYKMKSLSNNLTLGSTGFIPWDGIIEEGRIGRAGIYIILIDLFHPDGALIQEKMAFVLTNRI